MNKKTTAELIAIIKADKARTAIIDRNTNTGITSDGQHVALSPCMGYKWVNTDSYEVVNISKFQWITREEEE